MKKWICKCILYGKSGVPKDSAFALEKKIEKRGIV